MGHFQRLMFAVVGLVALLPGLAMAATYVKVGNPLWGQAGRSAASAEAWCSDVLNAENGNRYDPSVQAQPDLSNGAKSAMCTLKYAGSNVVAAGGIVNQYCPSGSFVAGLGGCYVAQACPAGQVANSQGVCTPDCPSSGSPWKPPSPNGAWKSGSRSGYNFCPESSNGCLVRGSSGGKDAGGDNYIWGPYSYTGGACADEPPANPGDGPGAPETCPAGTCPGTVNGTKVCAACDSTSSEDSSSKDTTTTTTNPDGSTTTTSSGQGTTTTTTCKGGKCTTTTTSTSGPGTGTGNGTGTGQASGPSGGGGGSGTSGNGTSTETTEESQGEYCKKNPTSVHCKESDDESSWNGTCESQFVCDGDAVQCAQAEAAWRTTCSLQTDRTHSAVTEGNQAMQGTSNQQIRDQLGMTPGPGSAFALASMLDSTPLFGGGGGCPAGTSVSVGGGTYAISFGPLCDNARIAGVALQAFAYLVAAFIVFRRS